MRRPGPVTGAVLLWLALALPWLDRSPALWSDEAWFTQPAWQWLTQGTWATPMVVEYHGLDVQTWWMPPGFSLLLVPVLAVFGPWWPALRCVSVALGAGGVAAVTASAQARFGERAAWLLGLGLASHPYVLRAGRQVRMDIAVACFVAVAVWAWWGQRGRPRPVLGALALGATVWMHPIGWVWAGALAMCGRRRLTPGAIAVLLASVLGLVAWFAQGGALALEQLGANGASLAPSSLLGNVLAEWRRYQQWLFPSGLHLLLARWWPPLIALSLAAVGGWAHPRVRSLSLACAMASAGLALLPNKTWMYGVPLVLALGVPVAGGLAWLWSSGRAALARALVTLVALTNLGMVGVGWWQDRHPPGPLRTLTAQVGPSEQVLGSGWLWLLEPELRLWDVWAFAAEPPGPVHRLSAVDVVLVRAWEVEHVLPPELRTWLDGWRQVDTVMLGADEVRLYRRSPAEEPGAGAGLEP